MKTSGTLHSLLRDQASEISGQLRLLANPERLIMLCRLAEGEASVGTLGDLTGLSQSSVSQHLAMLRAAKKVEVRRVAQNRYYLLVDEKLRAIINALCAVCDLHPEAGEANGSRAIVRTM